MSVLDSYYGKVDNRAVFLWENMAFLLAYLHLTGTVSNANMMDLLGYVDKLEKNKVVSESIARAAEFYSKCFYEMLTTKTWTLPDRIVYNITHPQTWDDFSKSIPINDIDFLRIMEIWTKIGDFIVEVFNPEIKNILRSEQN